MTSEAELQAEIDTLTDEVRALHDEVLSGEKQIRDWEAAFDELSDELDESKTQTESWIEDYDDLKNSHNSLKILLEERRGRVDELKEALYEIGKITEGTS